VSRQELLDRLWPHTSVTQNSVMQCVNELRRLLHDDARNPRYIRTISKLGYQFIGVVEAVGPEGMAPPPSPSNAEVDPAARAGGHVSALRRAGVPVLVAAAAIAPAVGWYRYAIRSADQERREVAWWKLDEGHGETTADSVAGLRGPLPRGVAWTESPTGGALHFTGAEVAVQGAGRGHLPRGSQARTLSARIRAAGGAPDDMVIFQLGSPLLDAGVDHFHIGLHNTGVAYFGNQNFAFGRSRVDDGDWHQIAGAFEGGETGVMRLYVDGIEEARTPVQGWLGGQGETQWAIGRGLRTGTPFRGAIDDVRVFGRALRPSEVMALHRCLAGRADIEIGGQAYFFAPVFGGRVSLAPPENGEVSTRVRMMERDFGGITFVRPESGCAMRSIRGADIGQSFRIEAELRFEDAPGLVSEAGPYFRSRAASPGDGLIGGTSAGFWVQLASTGQVRVVRLHPYATIAFSRTPSGFNPRRFHKLAADLQGGTLRVTVDEEEVEFDVGGVRTPAAPLDPKWETASPAGINDGSAGFAFGASRNRGRAGGQEVRNIRVTVR